MISMEVNGSAMGQQQQQMQHQQQQQQNQMMHNMSDENKKKSESQRWLEYFKSLIKKNNQPLYIFLLKDGIYIRREVVIYMKEKKTLFPSWSAPLVLHPTP